MITYVLPLLLAFTGGRLVHGHRGGVAGALGTIGLIVGAEIPMFLGAMIMGPLSAWLSSRSTGSSSPGSAPASRWSSTTSRSASWAWG